jgi:hypothetical protein
VEEKKKCFPVSNHHTISAYKENGGKAPSIFESWHKIKVSKNKVVIVPNCTPFH